MKRLVYKAVTSLLEDFCAVFDIFGRCHGEQAFSRICDPFKELFSFFSTPGEEQPKRFPFGTGCCILPPTQALSLEAPVLNLNENVEVRGTKMFPP